MWGSDVIQSVSQEETQTDRGALEQRLQGPMRTQPEAARPADETQPASTLNLNTQRPDL
jgi:hypothetical protein